MEMASNEIIKQAVMAGMDLDNALIAVLDVEGAPVVRAWSVARASWPGILRGTCC